MVKDSASCLGWVVSNAAS